MIEKTIELIDDEHVLFTVIRTEGGKVRSKSVYHLAKRADQTAEEVCRLAYPAAFDTQA